MNFDFKVIARSFPAIALVIAAAGFLLDNVGVGVLFAIIAITSFIAGLVLSRR